MSGLQCRIFHRNREPEDVMVDADPFVLYVGDSLNITSLGDFLIVEVEHIFAPGRNYAVYVLNHKRHCPECDIVYGMIHPDSPCELGMVEAVMES